MKKLYVAILCSVVFFSNIADGVAKENKDLATRQKIEHVQKMEQDLAKKLSLTDAQQEKAKEIRQKGREQMKEMHKKMQKLRRENMKEFEDILTEEQKEKFEAIKKERKKMHKKHMQIKKQVVRDSVVSEIK